MFGLVSLVATATIASSTTTSNVPATARAEAAPAEVAAPPDTPLAEAPPAVLRVGPGLSLSLGDWSARLLGQYWARFIGDSGRRFQEGPWTEYVGQRARFGLESRHTSGFGFRVLLQDVRTWGEDADTLSDFSADGFDLQEAFVDLPVFGVARARVGRQELVIENARIIGNVIWTLRARSFDGARLEGNWDALKAMVFYAKVKERDQNPDGHVPGGVVSDRNLALAHASYDLGAHHFSMSYFFDGTADGVRALHTFGPTARGKIGGFDYSGEAFLQLGEVGDVSTPSFLLAARAGYELSMATKPSLHIHADVLSSDGTVPGTFDTLYATNHKFYGEMDLFLDIPNHTGGRGLIDAGAAIALAPLPRTKFFVNFHDFRAYAGGGASSHFGDELDVRVVVQVLEMVELTGLYGVFVPGDLMMGRFGDGADRTAHFAYVTLAAEL